MTDWQSFCLTHLGVEHWIRRESLAVVIGDEIPLPLSGQFQSLFEAMLKAMNLNVKQVRVVGRLEDLQGEPHVWILGQIYSQRRTVSCQSMTQTKGLAQLLSRPIDKKEVFKCLQEHRRLMVSRCLNSSSP